MGGKRSGSKPKIQWAVALGAAGAWFGQHCGAGFASGVQEITYFVNAGWLSLFTTLVPMFIIGIAFYYLGEYAREIHASSYKDVTLTLYSSNRTIGKIMLFVYDLIIMASVLVMSSSTLAGAGSLLNETLGIDYTLATVLFMFVVAGISMFGAQFLAKLNLPMSIVLVGGLVIIAVALIGGNWDNLSGIIASRETFGAKPDSIVMNVISYTLTQTGFAGAYMAIAGQFTSKTETRTMAIAGIVINTGRLLLVSLAVRNLIRWALGFSTGYTFTTFQFEPMQPAGYAYVALAALAAARRELRSAKYFAMTVCIQLGVAYGVTFLVYQIGRLIVG